MAGRKRDGMEVKNAINLMLVKRNMIYVYEEKMIQVFRPFVTSDHLAQLNKVVLVGISDKMK